MTVVEMKKSNGVLFFLFISTTGSHISLILSARNLRESQSAPSSRKITTLGSNFAIFCIAANGCA